MTKNCPFCGNEAMVRDDKAGCGNPYCVCFEMPMVSIIDWNHRPEEDKLKYRIQILEEKIEFTKKDMMAQSISDVKEIRRANEILTQKVRSLRKILSED